MKIFLNTPVIQTYKELMKTIHQLVKTSFGDDKVFFTAAYPDKDQLKNVKTPIITYYSKKVPGTFGRTQEIKPRERGTFSCKDEDENVYSAQVKGQIMEYVINFEVWGRNGLEADNLADDFEMFMAAYTSYLVGKGLCHVGFLQRDDESNQNSWRNDLVKRKITYKIIMDQISSVSIDSIKSYDIILVINEEIFDSVIINNI